MHRTCNHCVALVLLILLAVACRDDQTDRDKTLTDQVFQDVGDVGVQDVGGRDVAALDAAPEQDTDAADSALDVAADVSDDADVAAPMLEAVNIEGGTRLEWLVRIKSEETLDGVDQIAVDAQGRTLLGITPRGTVTVAGQTLAEGQRDDRYTTVVMLTPEGRVAWSKVFKAVPTALVTRPTVRFQALAMQPDGRSLVALSVEGALPIPELGANFASTASGWLGLLLSYGPDGELLWHRTVMMESNVLCQDLEPQARGWAALCYGGSGEGLVLGLGLDGVRAWELRSEPLETQLGDNFAYLFQTTPTRGGHLFVQGWTKDGVELSGTRFEVSEQEREATGGYFLASVRADGPEVAWSQTHPAGAIDVDPGSGALVSARGLDDGFVIETFDAESGAMAAPLRLETEGPTTVRRYRSLPDGRGLVRLWTEQPEVEAATIYRVVEVDAADGYQPRRAVESIRPIRNAAVGPQETTLTFTLQTWENGDAPIVFLGERFDRGDTIVLRVGWPAP